LEILIKAKQANNRDFAFLDTRHYLHPYYKHVRWLTSSGLGSYGSSDDEDGEDTPTNKNESAVEQSSLPLPPAVPPP
jgi:hypothetical protein